MSYTCISCRISFASSDEQRDHYHADWHRYNLKRKIVGMAPVTALWFQERLQGQQDVLLGPKEAASKTQCRVCNKVYASENALRNHLEAKSHKENLAKWEAKLECMATDVETAVADEVDNENSEQLVDEEVELVDNFSLGNCDCLFCPHTSGSFEENMAHMTEAHSFYIPNHDYLVNLEGFIDYLGQKVSEGLMCLYCNERSPTFYSLEAVQKHMVDKGHCMVAYEQADMVEYEDFYDFSTSYPDYTPENPEQKEMLVDQAPLEVGEDGTLVLPSGTRIGNRDLLRYYKQHFRSEDMRVSVQANKHQDLREGDMRRAIGYGGAQGPITKKEKYDQIRRLHCQSKWYMKTGVRANGLMKHFRLPNGFCQ